MCGSCGDLVRQVLRSVDVNKLWTAEVCQSVAEEIFADFDQNGDGSLDFQAIKMAVLGGWEPFSRGILRGLMIEFCFGKRLFGMESCGIMYSFEEVSKGF